MMASLLAAGWYFSVVLLAAAPVTERVPVDVYVVGPHAEQVACREARAEVVKRHGIVATGRMSPCFYVGGQP